MIPILLKTGLRYFSRRKSRAFFHIWGICLGVSMIVAVAISNNSIQTAYHSLLTNVAGAANVQLTGEGGGLLDSQLLQEVKQDSLVQQAVPIIRGYVNASQQSATHSVYVLGIDPAADSKVRSYSLVEGTMPTNEHEVVPTEELAKKLNVKKGNTIKLTGPAGEQTYTVQGILSNNGIGKTNLGDFALLNLQDAADLFAMKDQVSAIDVIADQPELAIAHLSEKFEKRAHVGTHTDKSETLSKMMQGLHFLLYFSSLVSVVTAVFVIYNNLFATISDRRYTYAVLRSIGVRRSQIFRTILVEALLMGIVGSVIGVVMAYGMAQMMTSNLLQSALAGFHIELKSPSVSAAEILLGLGVGMGSTLIASLLPAMESLIIMPAEVFKDTPAQVKKVSVLQMAVKYILLLGGAAGLYAVYMTDDAISSGTRLNLTLVFIIVALFGVVSWIKPLITLAQRPLSNLFEKLFKLRGRLAADHFSRNRSRTSVTLAALVTGVTFLVAIASYSDSYNRLLKDWIDGTIGWDIRVSTEAAGIQAKIPLPVEFGNDLQTISGVDFASPQRFVFAEYNHSSVQLSVFEMSRMSQYAHLEVGEGPKDTTQLFALLQKEHNVAITSVTANKHNLHVNDSITLPTPTGSQEFQVIAILNGYSPSTGEIYMDSHLYQTLWNDHQADAFAIQLAPTASIDDVTKQIQTKWTEEKGLVVQNHTDFKNSITNMTAGAFQQVNGLLFLAVLVASLGISNALVISIRERAKEIGMLRAIGMRQRYLQSVVWLEGLAIGLFGGAIGSVAGYGLYLYTIFWNRKFEGLELSASFPTLTIITGFVLSIVVALLASWWPSRQASSINVVNLLRQES